MSRKQRILLVDDDEDILDLLKYNFACEGYVVKTTSDSTEAVAVAITFRPDLVILDLMMPLLNGIEVCKAIRRDEGLRETYIFFLSAKSDEYFRHAVFNVGGDEFVEKIAGLKPLLSKVDAVLKKDYVIRKCDMKLRIGSLELHRGAETVYNNKSKVHLSKSEFEILFFFGQNKGRRISTDEIIATLWGSETYMDRNTVKRCLMNIRDKVGAHQFREMRGDAYCLL